MSPQLFCQLARFSDKPCDGVLIRAHLIPKQTIRRHVGLWACWEHGTYVLACGGPTGIGGHHGELDSERTLRIPRWALPPELEVFADRHGLSWYLDREYGVREPVL